MEIEWLSWGCDGMFLNRKEQIIVLILCGTLGVGAAVSYLKNRYPDRIEDFGVVKDAVSPLDVESAGRGGGDTKAALPDSGGRQGGTSIELNIASAEDFERLPGIGPHLARRIVEYRRKTGPFNRVEDLEKVKGIGKKTLEKLRPFVRVEKKR